jgi:UDP-N-acetylglucosamine acyltransferase
MIDPTARIDRRAELGRDVLIGPFVVIEGPVRIGCGCRIMAGACLLGDLVLGADCVVHPQAVLGGDPQDISFNPTTSSGVQIGAGCVFREGVTVHRATRVNGRTEIGAGGYFMAYAHIAHDCRVGEQVTIANAGLLGGFVEVGDRAFVSGNVAVHQHVRIGTLAMIGSNSFMNRDVPPFCLATQAPGIVAGVNTVGLRRAGFDQARRTRIAGYFRTIYRSGLTPAGAAAALEAEGGPDALLLAAFLRTTRRGITGHRMRRRTGMGETDAGLPRD